jgi:hypothetical protein
MTSQPRRTRKPEVDEAREFLEITRDFVDPRDAIREAISNALDWGASTVAVRVWEDRRRPDEELVLEIQDDGRGLNEERLQAFFDLGRSPCECDGGARIGYKGHGTKTYFNSRQIEVWSDSAACSVYAIMDSPLAKLMDDVVPEYEYDLEERTNDTTGTKIRICGYNTNQNKRDFAHPVLRDYVVWFTKFGSVEAEFGIGENQGKVLTLQGLGCDQPEQIEFGHRFPRENCDIDRLRREMPGEWPKVFAKRWVFNAKPVVDHPTRTLDVVFYIEGDAAKRLYNPMLRVRGRTPEYGMYKVEDRYGLWVCKDFIPVKRCNDWLGLGKRLETKYHGFVNCQDFRLTANRGDIGNTPPDLLGAIADTVKRVFEEDIIGSPEYRDYEEAVELEEQYQTANQERQDFDRRRRLALDKPVCFLRGVELLEPRQEMGVVALFNAISTLEPDLFPFKIVDYDSKRGYDALVSQRTVQDLTRDAMHFVEFKYMLSAEFNHSFRHLAAVVCWDCRLGEGAEVVDIENRRRHLRITRQGSETTYMLGSAAERHNIEVFVLKDCLKEKLGLEFRPRACSEA